MSEGFSIACNQMKIRYQEYDESLKFKNFLQPNDRVNVFISVESVLRNISRIPDLEKKIILERDFVTIMVSNLINLIAHYRGFFRSNGLDTKVYLYMTSLDSNYFYQSKYNDDYRSYYLVKWNENPKFIQFSEAFRRDILPLTKTYLEFIPDAYFLDGVNIEGSLIPYIVAKASPIRKNLIISEEVYDTQYGLMDGFVMHYLHREFKESYTASTSTQYLKELIKKEEKDIPSDIQMLYNHYPFFVSLLSVLGDKSRSLDGVSGVRGITLTKLLFEGIGKQVINMSTESLVMLREIFQGYEDRQEEFDKNFHCSSIKMGFDDLTNADCLSITNQIQDRIDVNSLLHLNQTVFAKYPLLLDRLFS